MILLLRRVVATVGLLSLFSLFVLADDQENLDQPTAKQLQMKACGSKEDELDYETRTDKSDHPTPPAPTDKALVYVLRPSMFGNRVQSKLAVDGEWKGVNRGNNYFYFTLEPAEHLFCSVAENHSVLKLKVEAGQTYYLQPHVRMGIAKARNELGVLSDEEGKAKLAHARLSVWEARR